MLNTVNEQTQYEKKTMAKMGTQRIIVSVNTEFRCDVMFAASLW